MGSLVPSMPFSLTGGGHVTSIREIIDTQLTDSQIMGCISPAVELVKSRLSGMDMEESLLIEIRRYLAAHFVALRDPSCRVVEEKIGEASVKYDNTNSSSSLKLDGILSTSWGRTAASLDYTGTLFNLGGPRCRFHSLRYNSLCRQGG